MGVVTYRKLEELITNEVLSYLSVVIVIWAHDVTTAVQVVGQCIPYNRVVVC